jgi:hypothetical protein
VETVQRVEKRRSVWCGFREEEYLKCVWDRRRHLGPDLDLSKEAKACAHRRLVEFMRAVLRVRSKKSTLREKDRAEGRNVVLLLQDGLAQRHIE